jgi:hypothetical protein
MTFKFTSPPPEEATDKLLDQFRSSPPEARRLFLDQIACRIVDPEWRDLHRTLSDLHDLLGGEIE